MRCSAIGARGNIGPVRAFIERLRGTAKGLGVEAQAFDADLVFGSEHLLAAWEHTERAIARGVNVASDPMVEVLLFAAGERQIATAIQKLGLKEGQDRVALLIVGGGDSDRLIQELGLVRDDGLLDGQVDMLPAFGITKEEMETVDDDRVFDLVLERVALAELRR